MSTETLEARLRRDTRNFTAPLPEDDAFALCARLAEALCEAHAAGRHPGCDPAAILQDGERLLLPRVEGGSAAEDLFQLGALLASLLLGVPPRLCWRLDGPPEPPLAALARRSVARSLAAAPGLPGTFRSATEALDALSEARASERGPELHWPVFRGDPARRGSRSSAAPIARLGIAWRLSTPPLLASPLVAGPWVLAVDSEGSLWIAERKRGRIVDRVPLGAASECSPAVSGRALYAGTESGALIAVDLVTGRPRWRRELGGRIRSSPLPCAGRLIVGTVDGTRAGSLVALDSESGQTLWRQETAAIFSSPTLAGPAVLVGDDAGVVSAVDLDGGALWTTPLTGKVRATAAVAASGRALVADFGGSLHALDTASGSILWRRELGAPIYSSPSVGSRLCLVGSHDGALHGVEPSGGETRFSTMTGGPVVASPLALGEQFLAGSTDGAIYLLDGSGSVRQRIETGAPIQASPAVAGTSVFVGNDRGLLAVSLEP